MSCYKCLEFTDSVLLSSTSPHLALKLFSGEKKNKIKERREEKRQLESVTSAKCNALHYVWAQLS